MEGDLVPKHVVDLGPRAIEPAWVIGLVCLLANNTQHQVARILFTNWFPPWLKCYRPYTKIYVDLAIISS